MTQLQRSRRYYYVTVDESDVFNVGDIIQFSTTASTDDFDDGDFYRVTAIAVKRNFTIVQHPRGAGGLKRVCRR